MERKIGPREQALLDAKAKRELTDKEKHELALASLKGGVDQTIGNIDAILPEADRGRHPELRSSDIGSFILDIDQVLHDFGSAAILAAAETKMQPVAAA